MPKLNKAVQKMTYKASIARLEEILELINSDDIEIDQLSELVEESMLLVKACKQKLHTAEKNVEESLQELNDNLEEL